MDSKNELLRFYLLTLPALFVFSFLIFLFDQDLLYTSLFAFGFMFATVPNTPKVSKIVKTKKYRFSFLRLVYSINQSIDKLEISQKNPYIPILLKAFVPMVFILLIMLALNIRMPFYFVLLGYFVCEGVLKVMKSYL
jgi:hypothetical protein